MIPAPIPVFPLAAALVVASGTFLYASFMAGRGTAHAERGSKTWRRGLAVSVVAAVLGVATAGTLVAFLSGQDQVHSNTTWESVARDHGVHPSVSGQLIRAGVPFAAVVNGRDTRCIVNLAKTVACAGQAIAPSGD